VFESASGAGSGSNASNQAFAPNNTDKRFFWLAMYIQPLLWIGLAIVACFKLEFVWLSLVVIALVLTITNTIAFSRCDKFSQASNLASGAFGASAGSFLTRGLVGGILGRFFS